MGGVVRPGVLSARYFAFLGLISALAAMSANGTLPQSMLVLCAALSFASVWFLIPRINVARDSGQHSKFRVLHGLSVGINFLLIGAFTGLLCTGA